MFSIRGLRLYFPVLEPWVAQSALLPAVCPVYLCASVGPRDATRHSESGPLGLSARMWGHRVCQWSDCLPPFVPHSTSLCPRNASPLRPSCPSPPLLPVWMNVYFLCPWCRTSLPFDFPSVLVAQGGAVCLPMPPSWFSPKYELSCPPSKSL